MEEKKGVQVVLILLKEVDLQKAYTVGSETVGRNGGVFNGLNVFSLPGSPPRDKQTIGFFADPSQIGSIVAEITKTLGLSSATDILVQAVPFTQFAARTRPPQTAT